MLPVLKTRAKNRGLSQRSMGRHAASRHFHVTMALSTRRRVYSIPPLGFWGFTPVKMESTRQRNKYVVCSREALIVEGEILKPRSDFLAYAPCSAEEVGVHLKPYSTKVICDCGNPLRVES